VHRRVFEQLRNYSHAHLTLKKKVVSSRKNFITSKPNTSPSPKHAGSKVPNGTKNTRKHPKFRQQPLFVVCNKPIACCVQTGGSTCKKSKLGWDMKICYFYEIFVNSVFCPNWTNFFTIISGNLLHRIDQKKKKKYFKHLKAVMLVLSCHTFYKVTTGSTEYFCDIVVNSCP